MPATGPDATHAKSVLTDCYWGSRELTGHCHAVVLGVTDKQLSFQFIQTDSYRA